MTDIISNWEACLSCGRRKIRRVIAWISPPVGVMKFNVLGASRGKPGPAGLLGVLCNCKDDILLFFSKTVGINESNEVGVSALLEALWWFSLSFQSKLIVESDSDNVVIGVSYSISKPWRLLFLLMKPRSCVPI